MFTRLARKYGKTNAQIILRWHIQDGNMVIPGSKNPEHIKDNFDIFDFALSDEDMRAIAKINKGVPYYTQRNFWTHMRRWNRGRISRIN